MKQDIKKSLKEKQVEFTIQSPEYIESLKELSNDILEGAKSADNEASIESIFEFELFSFIKETLGLKYYPEKESAINTERHISKGRIDSKIGALIIEFKHTSKLKSIDYKERATSQLIEYLDGLYKRNKNDYLGVVTDGTQCKFVSIELGVINEGAFEKINSNHLDKIIRIIVLLDKVALTPENLVKDFCNPENSSLSKRLTLCLHSTLEKQATDKSIMLFNEWKELFRLAHNDKSKQRAIEERRDSLENVVGGKLKSNDDEYLVLYALQTTYAIIVKIIAYKVISKIKFNKSLIDFNELSSADYDTLRHQMNSLEEGAIFRSLGIGNLLEGDFFAWYSTDQQWNDDIGKLVQEIFVILTQYEDKAIFETGENVTDFFKDLYMQITPDKVRHSLGEFYTPPWLADNLISETLKLCNKKQNWTALDPCAGSGTFLMVLIKKVLNDTETLTKKQRLDNILCRVKAIDLNPLAVLTTRINYFINISPLISNDDTFEIPVYLGDSSYVPSKTKVGNIECLCYKIKTIKGDINIELPLSAVINSDLFSKTMTSIEGDIHNLDSKAIVEKLLDIISETDRTPEIEKRITSLAEKFIELEKNDWNGIWARIVTNFLTTANLGRFDIIVGNPPWIDWKNLPAGYRERIKSICVDRHLFSGDSVTGGINLNICALISNVAAQNWLKSDGILAFLMPQSLIFQQTYEGFRNFKLNENKRLYIQQLFDWTQSGHPFAPVQHKFLTFFFSSTPKDYSVGIPLKYYIKKKGINLKEFKNTNDYLVLSDAFTEKNILVGQANENNTIFSYANSSKELDMFSDVSGESYYIGRDGIDFYPQELFLLEIDSDMPILDNRVFVKNFQTAKSKHKIPKSTFPLETMFLYPMVKSTEIKRFHLESNKYFAPFPYLADNPRTPISSKDLYKISPLLGTYFNQFKSIFKSKTDYNKKIIGEKYNTEFYSLTRVGEYTYSDYFVAFRKDTKWMATVVEKMMTPWGELKTPKFQSHAVTISQDKNGHFINKNEAHFICAIINSPIVGKYIINSSDSRSFKVRPQINIPLYDKNNLIHQELVDLSINAHKLYNDKEQMKLIDKKLNDLVIKLKK